MANDGTLHQRETGVGIFDQLTFQNDTPVFGEKEEKRQEEINQQAHQLAYDEKDHEATKEMTDAELEQLIQQQNSPAHNAGTHGFTPAENAHDMAYGTSDAVAAERAASIKETIQQEQPEPKDGRFFNEYNSGPYADPAAGYSIEDEKSHKEKFYDGNENKTIDEWQAEKNQPSQAENNYSFLFDEDTQSQFEAEEAKEAEKQAEIEIKESQAQLEEEIAREKIEEHEYGGGD